MQQNDRTLAAGWFGLGLSPQRGVSASSLVALSNFSHQPIETPQRERGGAVAVFDGVDCQKKTAYLEIARDNDSLLKPSPLLGVSIGTGRGCQRNSSLARRLSPACVRRVLELHSELNEIGVRLDQIPVNPDLRRATRFSVEGQRRLLSRRSKISSLGRLLISDYCD